MPYNLSKRDRRDLKTSMTDFEGANWYKSSAPSRNGIALVVPLARPIFIRVSHAKIPPA
ncbi:hypothetical protein M407DRAFT_173171 [Tulasnella calospora MUT 4182]|uniref:Uncharacterized protein n=1 Tax=Tulasnella calospora MUT 4182 TaxID=1051891 RepID=A0A0C3K7M2_9AGAM|nr:hypothetical protein M407DRAFT_173171 [Tulasnella calospora MUT 4182]